VNANYAAALMVARRYAESYAQFQKALELDPGLEAGHLRFSLLLATVGEFAQAIAELQKYAYSPGSWSADAQGYQQLMMVALPKQFDWQAYAGAGFALCGDCENSFLYLERAFRDRDGDLAAAVRFPALDPLRSDPRYADLMRRLGLPE
jgi:tetratricopeptide (TPR) repeat protein